MPKNDLPLPVFRSRIVQVASLLLLVQIVAFYALRTAERIPATRPLKRFPAEVNGWRMIQEIPIESEVQDLLRADDTLNRTYAGSGRGNLNFFVAFFKSQRAGVSPHSPKVCLPGSGWTPTQSGTVSIPIPGRSQPIRVNRYIVSRQDQRSLVLYWYQTPARIIANEYAAKLYLMLDSIRYHRSDTSMVRVLVPINGEEASAEETAVRFVQSIFNPLREYLPSLS